MSEQITDPKTDLKDFCEGIGCDHPDSTSRRIFDDRILFVSYWRDEETENPCDSHEGLGTIRSFGSRHVNSVSDPEEAEELLKSPGAVPLSYFEHGLGLWGVAGTMEGMPDFRWDGVSLAGVWVPDRFARENILVETARRLGRPIVVEQAACAGERPQDDRPWILRVGEGRAARYFDNWPEAASAALRRAGSLVEVTRAEDGSWAAKLRDGESLEGFKSPGRARGAALAKVRRTLERKFAAKTCEIYTKWCNGDCWGWSVRVFAIRRDPDGFVWDDIDDYRRDEALFDESTGGYYGRDEAVEAAFEAACRAVPETSPEVLDQ